MVGTFIPHAKQMPGITANGTNFNAQLTLTYQGKIGN